jgi:hypothetical protein
MALVEIHTFVPSSPLKSSTAFGATTSCSAGMLPLGALPHAGVHCFSSDEVHTIGLQPEGEQPEMFSTLPGKNAPAATYWPWN